MGVWYVTERIDDGVLKLIIIWNFIPNSFLLVLFQQSLLILMQIVNKGKHASCHCRSSITSRHHADQFSRFKSQLMFKDQSETSPQKSTKFEWVYSNFLLADHPFIFLIKLIVNVVSSSSRVYFTVKQSLYCNHSFFSRILIVVKNYKRVEK